jgi:DNA-3-methyladenine glycosylase II
MHKQVFASGAELAVAIDHLIVVEPRFRRIVDKSGYPALRRMPDGIEGLLSIIVEQLISLKAAAAIWQRVAAALNGFAPDLILDHSLASLQSLGLTLHKAKAFHHLARAVRDGELDFEILHNLPNAAVLQKLCALPGIGPWTANVYLLSAMARMDAWPGGDLALQVALQDLMSLADRPSERQMIAVSLPWMPYRAAAAHLLWSHYRTLKAIPQI